MIDKTASSKGIVMIVDDIPGNLALLSDMLSEAGYRVLVATDGLSAIEQISYLKPDIILLDVMMQGIDGFETCNRLKANPETADIPVLFMTALTELDDLLRGFDEGAVDYIVKPIRPPEVLARIDVQLNQARNLKRAEIALTSSPFSALAADSTGTITWLTPCAKQWLDLFVQKHAITCPCSSGNPLPSLLLSWYKANLNPGIDSEPDTFLSHRQGISFSAKISPCLHNGEYLLVLDQSSAEWDLESVRQNLGLTFREVEILMWVSMGKTNKEIGIILGSSPRTINKHLEHIFEKLGVGTRAAAVSTVLQRSLI
jgi:DNA-binding response OmpR family regulator/DNA-binding CsgD family transcriptional regulator